MKTTQFKKWTGLSLLGMATIMFIGLFLVGSNLFAEESGSETHKIITAESAKVSQWGFIAAAVAFSCGAIGAGVAISSVGSAAMGAMSEKPEIGGQALIFIALAEGVVVFGFITAVMILGKI